MVLDMTICVHSMVQHLAIQLQTAPKTKTTCIENGTPELCAHWARIYLADSVNFLQNPIDHPELGNHKNVHIYREDCLN